MRAHASSNPHCTNRGRKEAIELTTHNDIQIRRSFGKHNGPRRGARHDIRYPREPNSDGIGIRLINSKTSMSQNSSLQNSCFLHEGIAIAVDLPEKEHDEPPSINEFAHVGQDVGPLRASVASDCLQEVLAARQPAHRRGEGRALDEVVVVIQGPFVCNVCTWLGVQAHIQLREEFHKKLHGPPYPEIRHPRGVVDVTPVTIGSMDW
mmetsp:Transcript_142551/g.455678  ORF Transcript_142551/g.455678 Transcript_142551/m.455678 type:complete len:207 (-) Transcript_142551:940-1560(-)